MSPIEGRSRSAGAFGASFALFALAVMIAHPARAAGEAAPGAIPEGAESAKAYESGALKTTKEQVVIREIVKEKEIIRVEPADPEVVYVPQYSPSAVYGPPPTPAYPAMMGYPPEYVATASLLSFGAGMAVGAAVWGGDCDWGNHNVYNNYGGGGGGGNQNVNINKNKERNVDRSRNRGDGGRQSWQHNPEHRAGVGYRDQASAKKYGGGDRVAARDRANSDVARGFDRGQPGGARPSQQPAGGRQQAAARPGGRPSQQPAGRPGGAGARPDTRQGGGAFGGYENGRSAREASTRGAASRGGPSYAGGGGGQRGRQANADRAHHRRARRPPRRGGRLAPPDPDRARGRRLALRHRGGQGGTPQSPHRPQRTHRDRGVSRVRQRAEGVRKALPRVCPVPSQHTGQARRPLLGGGGPRREPSRAVRRVRRGGGLSRARGERGAGARSATPCASDLEKFRSNVPVGGGWILAQEMGRLAAICRFDILRFCWDVSPGHGRVARCVSRIEPISHRSGGRPSVPRTGNRGLPPINARR